MSKITRTEALEKAKEAGHKAALKQFNDAGTRVPPKNEVLDQAKRTAASLIENVSPWVSPHDPDLNTAMADGFMRQYKDSLMFFHSQQRLF